MTHLLHRWSIVETDAKDFLYGRHQRKRCAVCSSTRIRRLNRYGEVDGPWVRPWTKPCKHGPLGIPLHNCESCQAKSRPPEYSDRD